MLKNFLRIKGDERMRGDPVTDSHKRALIQVDEDFPGNLKEAVSPEMLEKTVTEAKVLMAKYGVPSLGGSFGGLWSEDGSTYVKDLLSLSQRVGRPLRIVVEPEASDLDAHHWAVSYDWLEWNEGWGWVSLKAAEKRRKGGRVKVAGEVESQGR